MLRRTLGKTIVTVFCVAVMSVAASRDRGNLAQVTSGYTNSEIALAPPFAEPEVVSWKLGLGESSEAKRAPACERGD